MATLSAPLHDDRKGHHYYTRLHRPAEPPYIVVMTLAVIMGWGLEMGHSSCFAKKDAHPSTFKALHRILRCN